MNVTDVVLAYAGEKKINEHPRYVNRTKLDFENLTLWISSVEILDSGPYQCIVQSLQSSPDKPGSHLLCGEPVTLFVTGRWVASPHVRLSSALGRRDIP